MICLPNVKTTAETFRESENYRSIPKKPHTFLKISFILLSTVTLTWQLIFLETAVLGSCFAGCHYSHSFFLSDNMSESLDTYRKIIE